MRNYSREEIDYSTWYSSWMKSLAKDHTINELQVMLNGNDKTLKSATKSHLSAIEKTASMQGRSQHRAQSRNCAAAAGDKAIAIAGAIEIHELFPEHAKSK